jgi:hypothetical protein
MPASPLHHAGKFLPALTVSAAAAAALFVLAGITREFAGADQMAASNPVASAAWAQANCYSGLSLKSLDARTDAEVLLDVATGFESARSRLGIEAACAEAVRFGAPAIDPRTLPQHSAEPPLYDTPEVTAVN